MRRQITWNWLWWRVIICQGEGVKEGEEEWERTWEREERGGDERVAVWNDYVHRRQTGQTEDTETELILPFLEAHIASIALFSHD
jgi:hypothetical protein